LYEQLFPWIQQIFQLDAGKLHNLYSSPNIIRTIKSRGMKQVWDMAHIGDITAYTDFIRKQEWKRPLASPWHRWEDNTRCTHEMYTILL
jgi:hypothetical protein